LRHQITNEKHTKHPGPPSFNKNEWQLCVLIEDKSKIKKGLPLTGKPFLL
jgi:hypothetical protein